MAARWIALAIGLVMLSIVGVFVAAVLRPPPMAPSAATGRIEKSESGATRVTGRAGAWTVVVDLAQSGSGAVAIVVSIADAEGRPATPTVRPTATLSMVDMAMGREPVTLAQEEAGRWRGSGQLSMAGRWSLNVEVEGERISLPFEAVSPRL